MSYAPSGSNRNKPPTNLGNTETIESINFLDLSRDIGTIAVNP
jgi:hypothetical protein